METDDIALDESIQSYVPAYVWKLAIDPQKRDICVKTLNEGKSFIECEKAVVAMVDISGYSSLTSQLVCWFVLKLNYITYH